MLIPPILNARLRPRTRTLTLDAEASMPGVCISGYAVHFPDGDGFTLYTGEHTVMIRLFGCDAPEWGQPYARDAWLALQRLVRNNIVHCKIIARDRYGRLVCDCVAADSPPISLLLCLQGAAWWYAKYAPNEYHFRDATKLARQARRGLWKSDNPIPPWVFRAMRHKRKYLNHA